jgi:hypothetical protein
VPVRVNAESATSLKPRHGKVQTCKRLRVTDTGRQLSEVGDPDERVRGCLKICFSNEEREGQ